jgi:hypothetical protein
MRRVLTATLVLAAAALAVPAGAAAARHPAGIAGTVFDTTCPGACAQTAPAFPPVYQGTDLTVRVTRVSDGHLVATLAPPAGRFRLPVKRGLYSVAADVVTTPVPTCPPPVVSADQIACPLATTSVVMPADCWRGETKRVRVRRHRYAHVDLHVQNNCVVQPASG